MKIRCLPFQVRIDLCALAAMLFLLLGFSHPANAQRLSTNVIPSHYSLEFGPDLKAATFTGFEVIDVNIKEPTNAITLNANELKIQSVNIMYQHGLQKGSVSFDPEKEQATLTFPNTVPAGDATLCIHFTGILNDKLRGFYLSKTEKRSYAVTQFESTDARRAFPCFDEPAFKATFQVSLTIDAGDVAISNTPIASDKDASDWVPSGKQHTVTFETTPKMSTYLLAFMVGDFQCTSGDQDGVKLRVCATPDKVALTPFAMNIAKFALHYYDNYFGIRYPLKKLDFIGIPDFEAGAMENFGAITFRETDLLLDPRTATFRAQRNATLAIVHEMAHQWFGDLVTMQWWDNIWLNEGFATWMENKPVAAMHPEWNIDELVVGDLNQTLNLDAQPTTRAIRAKAETREEIEQMFDGISYGKASDVLLMVENYLGPETFRKGVHNYLAAHEYANATAEDFWGAQTATSHKPVDKIMESLVAQPGEPILTFGEPAKGHVSVTQKRFFLSPSIQPDLAQKWTVPVCFKSADGRNCGLLDPSSSTLKVPKVGLFFANAAGKGYYRSAYPPSVYAALVAGVESSLTPAERISLVGDEWAQVRANKASIGAYLDLVAAVKADPGAEVFNAATEGVDAAYSQVAATPEEEAAVSAWIRKTLAPEYAKLPPPTDSDSANTRELRALLFNALGYYGKDPAVLAQARQIADKYLTDPGSVEATLGEAALTIAARNGDAQLFDRLQQVYETSTNPEFQTGALRLLAQFEDPALAQRSFEYAVSSKVRRQDAAIQFAIALQTDATRDLAWKYIQTHWETIQALLTPEMGNVLVYTTNRFCSTQDRDSVKQFFTEHKVPAADQALKHSIESIDGCIELRALQEPNLKQWLEAQPKP